MLLGLEQDRGRCARNPERRRAQIAAQIGGREQVVHDGADLLDHGSLPARLGGVAAGAGDELLGSDADDRRDRERQQHLDEIAGRICGRAEERRRRGIEGGQSDEHHQELPQAVPVQRRPEHGDRAPPDRRRRPAHRALRRSRGRSRSSSTRLLGTSPTARPIGPGSAGFSITISSDTMAVAPAARYMPTSIGCCVCARPQAATTTTTNGARGAWTHNHARTLGETRPAGRARLTVRARGRRFPINVLDLSGPKSSACVATSVARPLLCPDQSARDPPIALPTP